MSKPAPFAIAGRPIGPEHAPYVIAELSANHSQDLGVAREIVAACAAAGADAVKLQTYTPDTMTLDVDLPAYRVSSGIWQSERLHDLYSRAQTPWSWTRELMEQCSSLGMALFSSPFDQTAVEHLESCGVPAYKVASFELTDIPLLIAIGRTRKPVVLSTGMSTKPEIDLAVEVLQREGCTELALLQCTSSYPAPAPDLNLLLIPQMERDYGVPIGFSDHTLGATAAIAAVALGACLVEKHVKSPRSQASADAEFSIDVSDFPEYVTNIATAHQMRGLPTYGPAESEMTLRPLRRSIIAAVSMDAGTVLTPDNVVIRRPGVGLAPSRLPDVLGRSISRAVSRGEGITEDLLGSLP